MRRPTFVLFPALLIPLTLARPLAAQTAISAAQAPRADALVLRALNSGADEVRVIFAVRDGTPSARALRISPDPAGEPARRLVRLAAQQRIADEMPAEEFRVRHFYGSFSLLSGTVTRAGALALANRADIDWITLDGTKKALAAEAQTTQTLIHSDQANALGSTGAGQTIAIVDTGVDYTTSVMGGGSFPNAKVIGGTDTANNDNDPMDCEGHGTSVAAVAASDAGVAPDAKIVAIKVFASKDSTNNACADTAQDSDIIAGVDWAITHQNEFGIGVINLSLGGAFADGLDHGYCDNDPSVGGYAAAFDSAVAQGIVVVVAAGNDGTSNALAAPACVSSAVSVGAVYPQAYPTRSWLDDSGGVQCTDAPIAPDEIICFSNSSTTLSMLAPGDFWIVARKGTGVNVFSGTSAASPSVAGAVALLRQTRPGLSPASLIGILRETGQPILDPRNGVTTPRLDTLAAVSLDATHFFPFLGTATSIPDGSGSASASVTVSGFSGAVVGLEVWVEIDHPDPQQLRVTLTGPDGTRVVLHDQTGEHEHPINAIYGKTDVPAESLGAFQGRTPNGVWTLTVEDKVKDTPSLEGRIRNFTILLQPGQPAAAIPPNAVGRVLPVVAHGQGAVFYQSDLHVLNPAAVARPFSLYFVPGGRSGAEAALATVTIGPGQVLAIQDVVATQFGFSASLGPIVATSTDPNFLINGHLYTNSVNGSFGHTVPGFSLAQGLSFGSGTATANGLIKSAEFHTNVGFTEVSGAPVLVRVDVLDGAGTTLGSTSIVAAPNTTPILGDVIHALGLTPQSNFRANFTVMSASGRIIPFATYVDNITGDSIFQPALYPASSADDLILAQAAHLRGGNNDFFQTNAYLTNLDTQPVTITVTLIPNHLTGPTPTPRIYTLAPGQTLEQIDVLVSEFGLSDPSFAGMRIHPNHPARLVVTNNTFVPKFGGTAGYSVQALPASRAVGLGTTVRAIGLAQTRVATGFRCNFGFIEVGGSDGITRVTARSGADGSVLGTKDFLMAANTLVQTSSRDLVGNDAAIDNFYLEYTVISGAGRMFAYATVNDNTSGDAVLIPAE